MNRYKCARLNYLSGVDEIYNTPSLMRFFSRNGLGNAITDIAPKKTIKEMFYADLVKYIQANEEWLTKKYTIDKIVVKNLLYAYFTRFTEHDLIEYDSKALKKPEEGYENFLKGYISYLKNRSNATKK